MNSKELEKLKDKYVLGTLTELELASLEVEMLQNPNMKSELKTHKDLVKGVQYAGELELHDMIDKIYYQQSGDKQAESKQTKNRQNYIIYYIVGLVLLIAIGAYFLLGNKTTEEVNSKRLYAEFYNQYKPSLKGRGASQGKSIIPFNEAYKAGSFQLALTIIKPYLAESGNDIKLTAAIAANEIDDMILAEKLFNEIIESRDYYFVDHAIWYKALMKLKTNKTTEVKSILTPLTTNPNADHHKVALELLSRLNG